MPDGIRRDVEPPADLAIRRVLWRLVVANFVIGVGGVVGLLLGGFLGLVLGLRFTDEYDPFELAEAGAGIGAALGGIVFGLLVWRRRH
jgi:hypothetical protein